MSNSQPPKTPLQYQSLNWSVQVPCYGGSGALFVDVGPKEAWRIKLSPVVDWLLGFDPGYSGVGPGVIKYGVAPNQSGERQTGISVIAHNSEVILIQDIRQESG